MENATAASDIEAGSWNRIMIKAHGKNVFLNKVIMRSNHFAGGIQFVGANVTASQVTIIDNVGRNYLVLAENIDKDANPVYSATLINVHISGGASFVRQTGATGTWDNWNSMLIEYPTESIKFNNVTVNMEAQDIGCMKVPESKKEKLSDFVDISCPRNGKPFQMEMIESESDYTCTRCGSMDLIKGSMSLTLITLVCIILFK